AAMRRSGGAVETFSIGFDDRRYDERSFAKAVAQHLGTKHHEFCVAPRAAEDLPRLAAAFGQPFADSSALPTHYLSRETRSHVKVALSGDGGDELFGGYDRYRAMLAGERFRRVPTSVLKIIAASSQRIPGTHPKSTGARLKRFAATLSDPGYMRYARFVRLFDSETVEQLLTPELRTATRDCDTFEYVYNTHFQQNDVVRAALAVDRLSYLPGDLLTKVDRASMLHALEVRSPFMDHELVEFAAGLTTDQLLKGGPKRMLREAFAADLPAWVFKRKKMGFAVPIGDWFRGELRGMLRDHLFAADSFAMGHFNRPVVERLVEEHETGRADHSQRLYALLMLELWWCMAPSP
ncbi:MAG: asnB 3, partial [Phycisphaerales bacterium]|nr:asnB 3 [Phycisphaerales bacterium]